MGRNRPAPCLGCCRLLPDLALIVVFFAILGAARAVSVEESFEELFGAAAAKGEQLEQLLTQLELIIDLGATEPGKELRNVHEYDDKVASKLGQVVIPSLKPQADSKAVDAWASKLIEALPDTDETQSFAMIRRMAVAVLLRVWLENGAKDLPGDPDLLKELMVKLYETHRLGAVHKGVMEYMHVSKSGGTSWCHVAQLNGCRTEEYDSHYVCMIKQFDDKVRWLNKTFHMDQVPAHRVPRYVLRRFSRYGDYRKDHEVASCEARHEHVHRHDYSYYSNEYTVHGGHDGPRNAHLCRDFFNAILMRNPRSRLASHIKFVMYTMGGPRGYNDTELFNMMYANRTSSFWQSLGPAVVDNYFIRSLLGEEVFHAPVGGISPAMLRLAQQVLLQFDLLMVLEQVLPVQDMEVRNLILYYGVGWKHTLEEVHDKDSTVRESEFDTSKYMPHDLDWLLDQQGLDMKLYEFSKVVSALDPVVYRVAKGAGLVPLPDLAAASFNDDLHCGLLRGLNGTKLAEAIGSGRESRKMRRKLMNMIRYSALGEALGLDPLTRGSVAEGRGARGELRLLRDVGASAQVAAGGEVEGRQQALGERLLRRVW